MFLLDFSYVHRDLSCLIQGTPHGTQHHNLFLIVLQMTAFVAINVKDFAHVGQIIDRIIFFVKQQALRDRYDIQKTLPLI